MLLANYTGPSPIKGFSHRPIKGTTSVQPAKPGRKPKGLNPVQSTNNSGCVQLVKPGHSPNKGLKPVQSTDNSGCVQLAKPGHNSFKSLKPVPTTNNSGCVQLATPSHSPNKSLKPAQTTVERKFHSLDQPPNIQKDTKTKKAKRVKKEQNILQNYNKPLEPKGARPKTA